VQRQDRGIVVPGAVVIAVQSALRPPRADPPFPGARNRASSTGNYTGSAPPRTAISAG
jgi:hypothetical protein